ncbi:hypothetical protein [Natronorubrum daqingense]|uniref:Polysaccharide deacetylase n=1 Tax=Natronorubrum daqingense TaxID=588898 RepID=A0A1N6XMX3_9EURY|nr:hypothetical protein [Natronorubrum daqingense]APX95911.1 hypothetical protein BB347_04370 [Natronorubrum daqingense]SIR03561.1 hypothetical protein SAMN05421809_0160 [Natronorubrum daqingense]
MSRTDHIQNVEWSEDFSYDYYRQLIDTLETRFDLRTLSAYPESRSNASRTAFVRHDVDVCLEEALELAYVEHELGISTTYMVFPRSPLYDLEAQRDILLEIQALGHEIGLHCDLGIRTTRDRAERTASREGGLGPAERATIDEARSRLEAVGVGPVESMSFHRPAEQLLGGPPTISGMVNAYSSELLSAYISDSGGRWREGPPIDSVRAVSDADSFQLLTHPVWWGHEHVQPIDRLDAVAEKFDVTNEAVYDELVAIYPSLATRLEHSQLS